jgi:hypothetical protein
MGQGLRILILGYIVRGPLGGLAWHHLQYAMGLSRLGHDVYFLEDSDDHPSCYDPVRDVTDSDPRYGLQFADRVFRRVGLADRWAYFDAHTGRWFGPAKGRGAALHSGADLVLNLSAVNPLRSWLRKVPVRALIDTDPAFTQIRHLTDRSARDRALRHNVFFSFAHNLGRPDCTVPDDGLPWQPTRQPVVLDAWPVTAGPHAGRFTSVMQWDSYSPREHGGMRYGLKSDSFRVYVDLPRRAGRVFELAMGSRTAPRSELAAAGWRLCDPRPPTRDPWTYQRFIRDSKAEFAVAKHGYVASRSGWFSERSAGYLASGRPVLAQDTGFSEWLPTGIGLIGFSNPEEAVTGVDEIDHRYELHSRAAREIVEEHFDSRRVLPQLLEAAVANAS